MLECASLRRSSAIVPQHVIRFHWYVIEKLGDNLQTRLLREKPKTILSFPKSDELLEEL